MKKTFFFLPDDLSTKIFAQTFSEKLRFDVELHTVAPVYDHDTYLKDVKSIHHDIPMTRSFSPFLDLLYMMRVLKLLIKHRPETVITFTTKPNILVPIVAKIAGVSRIIVAVRGLGRFFNKDHSLARTFFLWLYKITAFFSDYIWVSNPIDLDVFTSASIKPRLGFIETSNAISLSEFDKSSVSESEKRNLWQALSLKSGEKVVILVGRMIASKGVKDFFQAAKIIYRDNKLIKFILVAPLEKGTPDAVPESYFTDNPPPNFQWLGKRNDIKALYSVSHLSVLPSYYAEGGNPRALLEAMAFGLPVIAGDTPLCRGPVCNNKNGYLVPVKDPQALADAILKVFSDDDVYQSMSAYSYERVKREFNDEFVVEKISKYL